ncbi:hypothetical protein PASLES2_20845 [Pseudomonas aeruginosa]
MGHDHDHAHDSGGNTVFGFWLYLMTDCVLFASVFATYAVLVHHTAGGPSGKDIFELPYVLVETAILLVSSCTYGLAMLSAHKGARKARRSPGSGSPSCSAPRSSAWRSTSSTT